MRKNISLAERYELEIPQYPYFIAGICVVLVLGTLYFLKQYNFNLFHSFAEGFAITVGITIFFAIWNSSRLLKNNFYFVAGVSFIFVALFRFLHALAYKGVGQFYFPSFDPSNLATQLWIAGSLFQSLSFLAATFFVRKRATHWLTFLIYSFASVAIVLSIFYFRVFPASFIAGKGLTEFKIISEYMICGVYLAAIAILLGRKKEFDYSILRLTIVSIIFLIMSELSFTLYTDPFGFSNMIGHFFAIFAYYLFYRTLVVSIIYRPQRIIFRDYVNNQEKLLENQDKLREYARQLQLEKNEDEALLSSIGDGVVATDNCGRIMFANRAFSDLFDLANTELINRNLDSVVPLVDDGGRKVPIEKRPLGLILYSMKNTQKIMKTDQFSFKRKDKVIIRLLITASPIINKGRITGVIGIYRDITKEKDLERTKSELISFAAHQLRTPLTTLGLTTELLYSGKKKIDKETRENLNYLKQDIDSMAHLVNTFLNVSRVETGRLKINPELDDVKLMIKEMVNRAKKVAKQKEITIIETYANHMPYIKVDQNIFNTIIENLLMNSIKYTPENGQVVVKATTLPKNLLVEIVDSGPGIPASEHGKVFDSMFRGSTSHGAEGLGLGLYIVRSMIKQCGGKVWFESPSPYHINSDIIGTTFYFSLPLTGMKQQKMK